MMDDNAKNTVRSRIHPRLRDWLLFLSILAICIFSRTWEFNSLPPGLNQDEASIGVDAYDVYKFGMDRNGVSYPIPFTAFCQEQNTLYGYILIPFIAPLALPTQVSPFPILSSAI